MLCNYGPLGRRVPNFLGACFALCAFWALRVQPDGCRRSPERSALMLPPAFIHSCWGMWRGGSRARAIASPGIPLPWLRDTTHATHACRQVKRSHAVLRHLKPTGLRALRARTPRPPHHCTSPTLRARHIGRGASGAPLRLCSPVTVLRAVQRQFNFFRMLGCVECGAEASTAAEIYACCAAAERMEECAGACMAEGPVSIGTPVDTPGAAALPHASAAQCTLLGCAVLRVAGLTACIICPERVQWEPHERVSVDFQ